MSVRPRSGSTAAWALGGAALLLVAFAFRPVVEGDGVSSFAYLHALWVDHGLNVGRVFLAAERAHVSLTPSNLDVRTSTGLTADFTPLGAALLSTPFYLAALLVDRSGAPIFAPGFQAAYTVASLFYGLIGLVLIASLAAAVTRSRRAALLATAVALGATPMLYYLFLEPSYTHTFSVFVCALFFLLWWRSGTERGARSWFALGLLGGFMGAVRFQDGPLAAIALLDVRRRGWAPLLYPLGLGIGFAPQLVVDHTLFGTWLPHRAPAVGAPDLWPGHYLQVLISSHNGLLVWTPAFALSLLGLALVGDRRIRLAAVMALLIEIGISGAQADWWGGHVFGMNRMLDLLPLFAVGLAQLAVRVPWIWSRIAAAGLLLWNLILMANFDYVIRTDHNPGYLGLLTGQLQALPDAPRVLLRGGVGRALILWPLLKQGPNLGFGLALLLAEAACVLAAVVVATRLLGGSGARDARQ